MRDDGGVAFLVIWAILFLGGIAWAAISRLRGDTHAAPRADSSGPTDTGPVDDFTPPPMPPTYYDSTNSD